MVRKTSWWSARGAAATRRQDRQQVSGTSIECEIWPAAGGRRTPARPAGRRASGPCAPVGQNVQQAIQLGGLWATCSVRFGGFACQSAEQGTAGRREAGRRRMVRCASRLAASRGLRRRSVAQGRLPGSHAKGPALQAQGQGGALQLASRRCDRRETSGARWCTA